MMKRIQLLLLFILMQCTLSAQVIFNYDAITLCEGDSYDLLKYQNNEVIVPVGWEIIGWSGISNTTVTPTASPTVYTLQYREIANPSVILTHDLSISLRPKPAVSISPKGSQIICAGQPIHIDKVSATNYDNLYWQYVQKGDKYYTKAIDATAVQGNIDNKMTYKLIATNNDCAVVAQDQMEYSVLVDDKYPIYRFGLSNNNARESTPTYYCGTAKLEDYVKPVYIAVPSTPTGDMSFDPHSSIFTSLPPNSDYLDINPINAYQKTENDIVKLTRYEVKWDTQDQYTAGGDISGGINYTNNYTLEVDLYFKACGTTKTYTYNGTLYLYPSCPSAWTPFLIYNCSEINGQGQFGLNNAAGTIVSNVVYENLTLPGMYLPQGTGTYRYVTFDINAPLQMTYRVSFDYTDDKGNKQNLFLDRIISTCYIKKQISYATATYDYGFKPWLAYNGGFYAPTGAEANNNETKMKGDTIETSICLGSPAYLLIASNVAGKQKLIWRNSERPVLRTQYNDAFYNYSYNPNSSAYELLIDSVPCLIFKLSPTKTTVYTGTLEGLEFAYKVNVVNNHIAAIDTAICRGQSIDLQTLERVDNINGTVAWNVSNTLVTPMVDTKYTVYGIARDKCAGQADYTITDNVTVHVDEQLWNTTVNEVSSCAGDRLNLNDLLNTNARSFKWYNAMGELQPDGIINIAGDTYYTVEMSNGCGTKGQSIQVKETPNCYNYEFAESDSLSTAICATEGLNAGNSIRFSNFTVNPLSNDGSPCEDPLVSIITQSTIPGTSAEYISGKIYYDTSFENVINYNGQIDSVQYEVRCEFKRDTAWAYFKLRDEQILSLSDLKINTTSSEITIGTKGMNPSRDNMIMLGLTTADGSTFFESTSLSNTTTHTFTHLPSFPDGKYYYFAYNIASMCNVQDSIVLRSGQVLPGSTCTTSDTTRIDTTILKGQSYVFNGKTYTDTASDTLWLKNSAACDSVVIMNLMLVTLKSDNYIACTGAKVTLELTEITGNTYSWYSARTGGMLLSSLSSLEHTKTAAFIDTVWLQINSEVRLPVPIYLGSGCGSPFASFCTDGTVLFKEDFGGNNTTDPDIRPTGISQVIGYTYNTGTVVTPGSYFIRKEGFHRIVQWYDTDDHTSPGNLTQGYLLQIDATSTPGQFYKYNLNGLCKGSHFYFSAWMKSSSRTSMTNKVNTIFLIEKPSGEIVAKYYTGNISDVDDTWKQYGFDFITPQDEDSLVFRIINNGDGSMGNDFVMDDIEIRLCVPPVIAVISPKDTVCEGQPVTFSANFTNNGSFTEPLTYKWFKQNDITNTWDEIATGIDLSYNSVKRINQGYYKVAVSSSGSIDVTNCRAMSKAVYLKVDTCLTNFPDNIEQEDCFSTAIKPSPWGIRLAQSSTVFAHPHYTPLAGDLDNDGIPEFVAVKSNYRSNPNGSLIVFEGNDVTQSHEIVINENFSYYSGSVHGLIRLTDELNPSDTIGLIVVRTDNALRSYKYESITSIPSFKINTTNVPPFGTIGFADFNNDGKPEIYTGNQVFDAYSLNYIGGGNSNEGLGYFHWNLERVSFAADVLPLVAGTELICGSVIYSVDVANKAVSVAKTITPPSGFVSDGQTEVADFNGDGLLDVLVKQNSSTFGIYAYDPRTGQIFFSKTIASGTAQNYPMIGDLNADGKPEIVLLYENTMEAYTYDGISLNKFWSISVTDASGSTGMTLFDFNQDGLKEIVYRDEVNLRIINGSLKSHLTGADTIVYNLSAFPITSSTTAEYPLVVDCDADGEAEIVSIGDITGGFLMTDCRLHVYKSLLPKTWPPARPIWNQYAYNVTNVNKDLTIPSTIFNNASYFANGKQPFNNFLEQATTLNENGDPFFIGEPDTTRIDTTILKGQSYTFGTKIYTTSVRDTLQFKNISGCDSLVILNLTVLDFYPDNIETEDCYKTPSAFEFKIKQLVQSSTNVPTYCTPIVGDIDDDGEVEIITFSGWKPTSTADYVSKNISIFNGTTLDLEASITTPIAKWEQVIALGDVDGVGGEPPYIFFAADSTYGYSSGNILNPVQDALYVYAYKFDKTSSQYVQVWKSDTKIQEESSAAPVQVADLNNDGLAEIIVGNDVFNGKTGVLLARNKITKIVSPIMFRITPFIGNLLGDNNLELAYHNDVYSVNLSNTNAFNANAFTKILSSPIHGDIGLGNPVGADFNLDGHVDLAIVMRVIYNGYSYTAPIRVAVWDVYNNTILASVKTPDIYSYNGYKVNSSVPLVGDVNNDGVPEICFTTYNSMYCYAYNGTSTLQQHWNYTAITDQSGATGMTLFDFNQDGRQEIVYRDETTLYILDGSTQNNCKILTSIGGCYSGTGYEMPIVADVNKDNAAEIVTIGGTSLVNYGTVRVYASDATNAWAPARPVWNQAPYNVVHVNKDLTIPKIQFNQATQFPNGKRPFNAYLQQVTTLNQNGDPFYALQKDTFQLVETICEGKGYVFYGDTIKTTGKYFKSTTCDSTYVLNLTVNSTKHFIVNDSFCAGGIYSYNGKNYSAPGTFVDTLLSLSGCDSIVTLVLTQKQAIKTIINRKICSGQFFEFAGIRLDSSGTYIDSLNTSFGCDSIVTLNLMVMGKDTVYQSVVINQGETYEFNGQPLDKTGIYTANYINSNTCDSLLILDLVVITVSDKIKSPEVFTPNNDGKNDYFVIENLENYPGNDILIFNRWGNKVYEGKPYMNNWDGRNYFDPKLGGNLLPEGTYFYLLNLGDGSDVIRGYIYLNR